MADNIYQQGVHYTEMWKKNNLGMSVCFNPKLRTGNPKTGTYANSEIQDEMPHKAAFHQGMHCLLG